MRHALLAILIILATAAPALAAPVSPGDLATAALKVNPGLAARREMILALEQGTRRAGAWMDPMLAVEYSNMPVDRWAPGGHPMSGIQLKVQQTFPFPGKIGRRQEAARRQVQVARLDLAEAEVQLAAAVRRAALKLGLVRRLEQENRRHLKLLGQLIAVVRARYEVGKGAQHDLLRLELQQERLLDELDDFARDDAALAAGINAALRRGLMTAIATPAELSPPRPPAAGAEGLALAAARARPAMRKYSALVSAERARAEQARREKLPDITAWIGYRFRLEAGADPGTDFVSLGLGLPLPLWGDRRHGSAARAGEHRAKAALARQKALLDQVRAALGHALPRWTRAHARASRYQKELIPRAGQLMEATLAAYQVDRAGFDALYQVQVQLLDMRRVVHRAATEAALMKVDVGALTGREIK